MINEILNFIAKYTYHVLDEYGRPAKIPISLIKREFEKKFPLSWRNIVKLLRNKKWITSFNWGSLDHDFRQIRITSKGSSCSKLDVIFGRRDIKRILLWYEDEPILIDCSDWQDLEFYYDHEGMIVYEDKLALIKLMTGVKGNIE